MPIRPATPADAAALAQLRYDFRASYAPPTEDEAAFVARTAAWFRARLAQPHWRGWIAEDDAGGIVGHGFMQLIEKIPNPAVEAEWIAYLTNFYVVPAWRNAGLGRALLDTAIQSCAPDQVDTIILWPSARSRPLYLRHGFQVPDRILARAPDALQ